MINRLIYTIVITFIFLSASAQTEKQYNDTSYFIPYDDDFNLIMSASKGHVKNVMSLLERKADINAVTVDGISALMYATENRNSEMVSLLLRNDAEPNLKPYNGVTALISACQSNYFEIAEYLITNDANVNLSDQEGATGIHYAAAYNYDDLVEMLIFFNADFKKTDKDGNPPIITAAFNNCFETVDILLSNEVDINTRDKQGYTPLMVAVQENNESIVELLLTLGADVNLVNNGGMTALGLAIKSELYDITEELINAGANVNHKISNNQNLLELSREIKDDEITELLITEGAKASIYPNFSKFAIGTSLLFSPDEFMTDLNIDFLDIKYNTGLNAGFHFRPRAIRVNTKVINDTAYQYWERRFAFHVGFEKRFALISQKHSQSGPIIGMNAVYTFGSYRGSNIKPDPLYIFNPSAGWYYMNNIITLIAAYHYMDFGILDSSKGKMSVSLGFNINTARKKLVEKSIPWLTY